MEEAVSVVGRLLPGRMEVWRRKRDRRLEKKARAKEKMMKEWVSENHVFSGTCMYSKFNVV